MTVTLRAALLTFALGFLVEGAVEVYQFASFGARAMAWPGFYYLGLVTTGAGFYLMYRGRHEWTELHHVRVRRGHRSALLALVLFVAATGAVGGLSVTLGPRPPGGLPLPVVWLVGGLVGLSLISFFAGLWLIVAHLTGPVGRVAAGAAVVWSFGVAAWTGLVVGGDLPDLLLRFFTDPVSLVVAFAPLAFAMAPLFVSYFLFTVAYLDAYRKLRVGGSGPPGAPSEGGDQSPSTPAPPRRRSALGLCREPAPSDRGRSSPETGRPVVLTASRRSRGSETAGPEFRRMQVEGSSPPVVARGPEEFEPEREHR